MAGEIRVQFARRLRRLRRQRGWTQEELAERADLAYRHIQRLESLKRPPPAKIDTLEKLARAFQLSPGRLLEFHYLGGMLTGSRQEAGYLLADAKRSPRSAKRKRKIIPSTGRGRVRG